MFVSIVQSSQPLLNGQPFGGQQLKVPERLSAIHCNKNLYSMVTEYSTEASVRLTDISRLYSHVIVSLAFVNRVGMNNNHHCSMFFFYFHLFVLIFDKLKTGPRPTLCSGEPS